VTGSGIRIVLIPLLVGGAGVIGSCSSSPSGAGTDGPVISAGLDNFDDSGSPRIEGGGSVDERTFARAEEDSEMSSIFEENAAVLSSLPSLDGSSGGEAESGERAEPGSRAGSAAPVDDESTARSNPAAPISVDSGDQTRGSAADESAGSGGEESLVEKRARLAAALAGVVRAQAERSGNPFQEYLALAALEALAPGSLNGPGGIASLTPREADQLTIWRDLHRDVGEGLDTAERSAVETLSAAVERASDAMTKWRSLTIERAELCSRVEGYGVYTPLKSRKMLARRPHRAIVYVELDNFASSAGTNGDGTAGFRVNLEQEVALYDRADGVLAWRTGVKPVTDFSRNRRKEFYTVQIIELPDTLTIGAYRLKVTVNDETSGATAERIIPIEIVAQEGLADANGR